MDITKFALFKKMAGGSGGGGGGAELPTLNAPTISLSLSTLTITNPTSNGDFVKSFGILANGSLIATTTETTFDLSTVISEAGNYSISVVAKGTNFNESLPSESVNYIVKELVGALEEFTWDEIAQASADGTAAIKWAVGDTKPIELSTGEIVKAQIIGFNHDDLADGTGKAGITFQLENCLETTQKWNTSNSTSSYMYTWANSSMRSTLRNTILPTIPEELRRHIKDVTKLTIETKGGTNPSSTNDNLFLLSMVELHGTNMYKPSSQYSGPSEGEQYEYYANAPIPEGFTPLQGVDGTFLGESGSTFTNKFGAEISMSVRYYNANAPKGLGHNATEATEQYTRSMYYTDYTRQITISKSGAVSMVSSSDLCGVAFAFCV